MSEWQTIGVTPLPPGTATVYLSEDSSPRPAVALLHQQFREGDRVVDRVVLGYLDYYGEVVPVNEVKTARVVTSTSAVHVISAPAGLTARYGDASVPVVALRVENDVARIEVTPLVMHGDGSVGPLGSGTVASTWTGG